MIGGLVEQYGIRFADKNLSQKNAQLVATGEPAERLTQRARRYSEPRQHCAGARLECVPVARRDGVLETGEVACITRAKLGKIALLAKGVPDGFVPHHGNVQHQLVVPQESVLTKDSKSRPLGSGQCSVAGGLCACQDVQQSRLAGTIGTDQPVAAAGAEF